MYRLIDCSTWDDPWFAELEPNGKLFFLYLITNRRSTSAGAFEITIRHMSFESGLDSTAIERWLEEWTPRVMWWPEHNMLWLRNFVRYQVYNEKMRINARKIIASLPCEIQGEIVMEYPELKPREDTLSIPYPKGMDKTTATATATATVTASKNSNSISNTREKPPPSLYAETLNGSLPKLESMFQGIDQLFTPAWLAKELADAAAVIGPLSREQLGRGLDIAIKQIERQMAAKTVRNPRPFAHKLIVDYLTEQRDEHHAA